jgi:nitroreductase
MVKNSLLFVILMIVCTTFSNPTAAQEMKVINLPTPRTEGGMPLMEALKNRKTAREFSTGKLTDQMISNLLWAAWGINRPEQKRRTAPSSMNYQEIDVYVAKTDGLFIYNAEKNQLVQVLKADVRDKTGVQEFVKVAPISLVYVADFTRMAKQDDRAKELNAMADAAFISENVYLFCASEGLATGVRGWIDKDLCAKAMNLSASQHIMLAQSVGFPKED